MLSTLLCIIGSSGLQCVAMGPYLAVKGLYCSSSSVT